MPKVKMEICGKPTQTLQPRKCVCQPSTGEITIELDRATAFEFIKFWGQQIPKKQFKLSYDTADFNANPDVLKVTKVTAVPLPDRNIEEVYEISLDDVGKIVKLVKVRDGTFHYKVENNEAEDDENETNVTLEEIVGENLKLCEISGIYTLDDSQAQDVTEVEIPTPEESYKTSTQNRPPVIIRNEASTKNQSTQNEQVVEPTTPKSDQFPVEDMEVDTMDETNPEKASPTKLQKQLAEVAPFHHNKRSSPKRTPMTKKMLNEEFKSCRIQIGPNNTTVSGSVYHSINWSSVREATRKLLSATFSREVLASHSLTGKPSPAFRNLPTKKRLDPDIVEDIVHIVSKKCNVDARTVRSVITLKCADENKMLRIRMKKEREILKQAQNDKENCG